MKIVIYNRGDDLEYIGKFTNGDFSPRLVCSVGFLRHILSESPNEDIEGIILPTAKNNSELGQIFREIYLQKKKLYDRSPVGQNNPPHKVFAKTVEQYFPGLFP